MTLTTSTMLPLGSIAPDFSLPDTISGKLISLSQFPAKIIVIMFICNHCPYVKHILPELLTVTRIYTAKSVQFIAINANDVEQYPEDSPENMAILAKKMDFCFPYLLDSAQDTAKRYQAACTPDFYIFNQNLRCVYRGRFDHSSPGKPDPVTGTDLRAALDNLLTGQPVSTAQYPSMGCNIKWIKTDIKND